MLLSQQLNFIKRLYICLEFKETLVSSFIYVNCIYFPFRWHFHPAKSVWKIEKLQEKAFNIHNDFEDYYKSIQKKS